MNTELYPALLRRFQNYSRTIKGLSKKTTEDYGKDLIIFFRYLVMVRHEYKSLENVSHQKVYDEVDDAFITAVDRDTILSFLYYLAEDRNCSETTRKRRLSALSNFYQYIRDEEKLISIVPTENIPLPRLPKREPVHLTIDEIDSLMNAVSLNSKFKERDICIFTFFFHLGLRLEEISKINLQDIKKNVIYIYGKGNKQRILPLDDACLKALKRYLPARITPHDEDINALFTSRNRNRMTTDTIYKMVKKMAKYAGLSSDISPHPLRHTFATLLLEDSDDIVTLQALMGHESITTTEKYVHLADAKHAQMIQNNPLNKESQFEFEEMKQSRK